jgi:hypothetical protein
MSNSSDRVSRREALRRAAGAGALISLSSLAGFSVSTAEAAGEALSKFPNHPQWKFIFVSHVTTNPFWIPLRYGAEDACALLGATFQWTGSEKSIATEMVNAFNTAVSSKADGIAVALVDPSAFNDPVEKALAAGIPVVSYRQHPTPEKKATSAISFGLPIRPSGWNLNTSCLFAVPLANHCSNKGVSIPALLIKTSRDPKSVTVRLTASFTCCSFDTSPSNTSLLAAKVIREAVARAAWPLMSKKATG